MRLSVTPSTKNSCSGLPPRLAKGRTTSESRGGPAFSAEEAGGVGFACAGLADLERIHPDRFGDVLQFGIAEIADREIEPPFHLSIGVLGQADCAGLGYAFESGGDIDAVAHEVAVAFLDHVAQMNAHAEFDTALGRQAGVALDKALLQLDGAADCVHDAAELNDAAVARALDHTATMHRDRRIDEVAPERAQPRQNTVFVGAGQP